MSIERGSDKIAKISYGATGIQKMYLGDTVVFEETAAQAAGVLKESFTGVDLFNGITHTSGVTVTTTDAGGTQAASTSGDSYVMRPDTSPDQSVVTSLITGGTVTRLAYMITSHDDLSPGANNNLKMNGFKLRDGAGTLDSYTPLIIEPATPPGWTPVTVDGSGEIIPTDTSSGPAEYWLVFQGTGIKEVQLASEVYVSRALNILINIEHVEVGE